MTATANTLKTKLIGFLAGMTLMLVAAPVAFAEAPLSDDSNRAPSNKNLCEGRSVGEFFRLDSTSNLYVVCGPETRKFQLASSLFDLTDGSANWAVREQLPISCNSTYSAVIDWGYWMSGPGIALAEPTYDTLANNPNRHVEGVDVNFEIWSKGYNLRARTWAICGSNSLGAVFTGSVSAVRASAAAVRGVYGRTDKDSSGVDLKNPQLEWRWGTTEDKLENKSTPESISLEGFDRGQRDPLRAVNGMLDKLPSDRRIYYQLVMVEKQGNGETKDLAKGEVRSFKTRPLVGGELDKEVAINATNATLKGKITVDSELKDKQLKWYLAYGPCDVDSKAKPEDRFCDPSRNKTKAVDLNPAAGTPVAGAPQLKEIALNNIELAKLEPNSKYAAQLVIYEDQDGHPINLVKSDPQQFKTGGHDPSTKIAQVVPYASSALVRVKWNGWAEPVKANEKDRDDRYRLTIVELDSNGNPEGQPEDALERVDPNQLPDAQHKDLRAMTQNDNGYDWLTVAGDVERGALKPNTTYKLATVVEKGSSADNVIPQAGDEVTFTTRRGPEVKLSVTDTTSDGAKVSTQINANEQDGVGLSLSVLDTALVQDIVSTLSEEDVNAINSGELAWEELLEPATVATEERETVTGAQFERVDLDLTGKLKPGREYMVASVATMTPEDARTGSDRLVQPYMYSENAVIHTPVAPDSPDYDGDDNSGDGFTGGANKPGGNINSDDTYSSTANNKGNTHLSVVNQTAAFDGKKIDLTLRCTLSKGSCAKGSVELEGVGKEAFAAIKAGNSQQVSFAVASKMRSELQQYLVSVGEIPADVTIKAGDSIVTEQIKLVAKAANTARPMVPTTQPAVPNTGYMPNNGYMPSSPVMSPRMPTNMFGPNTGVPAYSPTANPNLQSLLGDNPQSGYPGGMNQPISNVQPTETSDPALLALAHKAGTMFSKPGETVIVTVVPIARSTVDSELVAADANMGVNTNIATPSTPGASNTPDTAASPTSSSGASATDPAALRAAEQLGEAMGSPSDAASSAVGMVH